MKKAGRTPRTKIVPELGERETQLNDRGGKKNSKKEAYFGRPSYQGNYHTSEE